MNNLATPLIISEKMDRHFHSNCRWIAGKYLPPGSVMIGYQLCNKGREQMAFDFQSCWLDISYRHEGEIFKHRMSHKNNGYISINYVKDEECNKLN